MRLRLTHTRLFAAILLILSFSHCAWATDATLTGTIRDPFGNAFNGQIIMTLSQPAVDPTGIVDYVPLQVPFTVLNGQLQTGAKLVSNDSLQPSNTYYLAQYFDVTGAMAQQKAFYFLAGANNLGSMIPTNITTSNVSYLSPISLSANNVFTGTNTFSKQIISTYGLGPPFVVASDAAVTNLTASHITSDNPFASGLASSFAPVNLAPDDKICWENHLHSGYVCLGTVDQTPAPDQFQWTGSTGPTTHILPYSHSFPYNSNTITNTIANSNLELVLTQGASFFARIAANEMAVGSYYRIKAVGNLTNTSGGASNYTIRIRFDSLAGPAYCASAVISVATGSSNVPWNIECIIQPNTIGGAGFAWADGDYTINATRGAITNAALISVDTTILHNIYISGQMSVINAVTNMTIHTVYMERLTQP